MLSCGCSVLMQHDDMNGRVVRRHITKYKTEKKTTKKKRKKGKADYGRIGKCSRRGSFVCILFHFHMSFQHFKVTWGAST